MSKGKAIKTPLLSQSEVKEFLHESRLLHEQYRQRATWNKKSLLHSKTQNNTKKP